MENCTHASGADFLKCDPLYSGLMENLIIRLLSETVHPVNVPSIPHPMLHVYIFKVMVEEDYVFFCLLY